MKKLIIKIGNETHELPYDGETYSVEVSDKYTPKVGDCVKVGYNKTAFYWLKIKKVVNEGIGFSLMINNDLNISKNKYFAMDTNLNYTQITPEELKAKYAEAGYDWDYESDTIKPLKWMPKDGDDIWGLSEIYKPVKDTFDKDDIFLKLMLEKGLLFKTEEECKEFSEHCLSYFKKS